MLQTHYSVSGTFLAGREPALGSCSGPLGLALLRRDAQQGHCNIFKLLGAQLPEVQSSSAVSVSRWAGQNRRRPIQGQLLLLPAPA